MSIIFFIIRRTLLGVTRELFTQLPTLKESTGHLGVTNFACFHHQAHNTGLSKNVAISPNLASDPELSYGLSWVIVTNQACGQQDQSRDVCNMEMKSTWGFLADPSECLTQGGRRGSSSMPLLIPFCHLLVPLGCEVPTEVTRAFELVWCKTQSSNLRTLWWPLASNLQLKISPFLPQ